MGILVSDVITLPPPESQEVLTAEPDWSCVDEDQLSRTELQLLQKICDLLPVGVTARAEDGRVLLANALARLQFGSPLGADCQQGAAAPPCAAGIQKSAEAGRTLLIGQTTAQIDSTPVVLYTSVDITEQKNREDDLARRAYVDHLTGLPNQCSLQAAAEELLRLDGIAHKFALAFLDIDNFKHINDYYTHAVGDELLKQVAQRIASHLRPTDTLGRISGDEFLLLLFPLHDETAGATADVIMRSLKEPFFIEGFEIFTSASLGMSIYPDHGDTYESLRRNADTAMYVVKRAGKGAASIFDAEAGRKVAQRMGQEQRLRLAVKDRHFRCAFQPKVDIRTEEVVGVEALVRLFDDDGTINPPAEFINLAVELGLIDDITLLVLDNVVSFIEALDDAFGTNISVSINLAAKQANDTRFMHFFCDHLERTGHGHRFVVEVTEDAFVAKSAFQQDSVPLLHQLGARVSIDDFGTGFSSLSVLSEITADEIKIDKSFITNVHQRPRNQMVLRAVEALANALGMSVVVEGVETFEELAYLQAATNIRYGQGYYFAKPLFVKELAPSRWLTGEPSELRAPRAIGTRGVRQRSRY